MAKKTNVSRTISVLVLRDFSTLRTRTEIVLETLVFSSFNHVTRLVAREDFIILSRRKSSRLYIKNSSKYDSLMGFCVHEPSCSITVEMYINSWMPTDCSGKILCYEPSSLVTPVSQLSPAAHPNLSKTRDGTPQNFASLKTERTCNKRITQ
jgi:hypothetical protein